MKLCFLFLHMNMKHENALVSKSQIHKQLQENPEESIWNKQSAMFTSKYCMHILKKVLPL